MKKPVYFLVIIIFFFSCNRNSKTPKKEKSTIDLTQTDKEEKIVEPKEELILPPPTNCNETFDEFDMFFERFSKDSVFQKNRVKYPLKYTQYDEYNYDVLVTEVIARDEFIVFISHNLDSLARTSEFSQYEIRLEKKDSSYVYIRSGIDNGINLECNFELIKNCWFLISVLNESI